VLVDLANERGGHDNITVVLIGVPEGYKPKAAAVGRKTNWLPWMIGGVAGVLILLLLASILTINLLRLDGNATATPGVSPTLLTTTVTLFPEVTPTDFPTETASPDVVLPVEPTFTLTPWPTNTVNP
jgi:hypothetical protein